MTAAPPPLLRWRFCADTADGGHAMLDAAGGPDGESAEFVGDQVAASREADRRCAAWDAARDLRAPVVGVMVECWGVAGAAT